MENRLNRNSKKDMKLFLCLVFLFGFFSPCWGAEGSLDKIREGLENGEEVFNSSLNSSLNKGIANLANNATEGVTTNVLVEEPKGWVSLFPFSFKGRCCTNIPLPSSTSWHPTCYNATDTGIPIADILLSA